LPAHVTHWQYNGDLHGLLQTLAQRGCNEVLVEAGATLAGLFLQQALVDELVIYMAPTLMGSTARPLFQLPFDTMNQAQPLVITDVRAMGNDWRFTATPVTATSAR
jgi:diaminohydroxyphosphoribosylaminopyrimidine deaminase/5-amino-6-(5-phosphoribosylamino)uracil reductase